MEKFHQTGHTGCYRQYRCSSLPGPWCHLFLAGLLELQLGDRGLVVIAIVPQPSRHGFKANSKV